ncbi:MAG: HAMP domain-containing histidine kinase [Chitinophagales bacterium]|nr:HAMP domain-containing histidine kinase [Chitinophagales bacterium]
MDIYSRKSKLKFVLIIIAFCIAVATLWYTNVIAGKIAAEEKKEVQLWAEAISNKARLVKFTNQLFERLAQDERRKVKTWADATKLAISVEDNESLTFVTNILTENKNIPIIQTDDRKRIKNYKNVDFEGIEDSSFLQGKLFTEFSNYPPIQVFYINNVDYIYYQDSRLFTELRVVLNDLIESFISEVINSASVPVLLTDSVGNMISMANLDTANCNSHEDVLSLFSSFRNESDKVEVDLGEGNKKIVYYQNSELLSQLKYYPFILIAIVGIFLFVSYLAFSGARKAEQNQVWVGMAKETAHQLGTPISSLAAWLEYIKETDASDKIEANILVELEKDVNRLSLVADRFSKIGSKPDLQNHSLHEVLTDAINYISHRASDKVKFKLDLKDEEGIFRINRQLFDWVIENILKNALDAMEGEGKIKVSAERQGDKAIIDITDNGKGIPKSKFDLIFQPGYSTKQRGWGLGLSLCKRIIENYHSGKIFVKSSTAGKGSTFRIIIPD